MLKKIFSSVLGNDHIGFVLLFMLSLSLGFFLHYFIPRLNLPYADSISRLDIARKVVDNLNPGVAQFGSVWLPLPQLLMLPFIWNNFMWQSGMAGAIMSMVSFVVGGYFIFKSAHLLSQSFLPSFFALCIYALNINTLYLQTTAMSECIFMAFMAAVMYFFLSWIKTNKRRYLIYAGVAVSGVTLIRYEGLALLLASIALVGVYSAFEYRSYKKVEGLLIIYSCIAGLGFVIWTLYLTAIFGDPLFWLKFYASVPTATNTATSSIAGQYSQAKPFFAAVWQYFTSVTWMSGLIPVLFATTGLLIATVISIKRKSWEIIVLLLPTSIFLLMVLTLQRNTPIVQPDLSVQNILSTTTSTETGFNIRYGIMMLPWVALLTVYVFNLKKPWYIPTILLFTFFSLQIANSFIPKATLIFEITQKLAPKPFTNMVTWMKENYDGGYILMSASGFEDQMFAMDLPYRTYIHEGAGKYWSEAIDRPARYADWIILDPNRSSDLLAKMLVNKPYWSWDYNLVWEETGSSVKIYKIKTHPDIIIPQK